MVYICSIWDMGTVATKPGPDLLALIYFNLNYFYLFCAHVVHIPEYRV